MEKEGYKRIAVVQDSLGSEREQCRTCREKQQPGFHQLYIEMYAIPIALTNAEACEC